MATSLMCATIAAVLHADENTYTVRQGRIGPGAFGGEYIARYRFSADGQHVMGLRGGDIVLDPSTYARGARIIGAPVTAPIVAGHELGHAFTDLLLQGAGMTDRRYYEDEAPGPFFESWMRSEMGMPQRQ